ncbi:MAG: DNA repair protein RadC, partial [Deltaproteobacteria bacterium]
MKKDDNLHAGHRKRLKDRFLKSGLEGFHDYEIVELLLTYAIPRRDVKPLAKKLITRFGGLKGIFDAASTELAVIEGVGDNAAILVNLIKAVSAEYLKERALKKDVVRSSKDVLDYLKVTLSGEKLEKFLAIYLNAKNEILSVETLQEGTIDQTAVYPRKAMERALRHNAKSVIFVHNHPSGDATPSKSDREL